ncbi:MAG: hypothetical protein K5Q00_02815 [Gammaproteobacteria bacterium]|nr:hypothetical protein [Gammaproteobacteria bacterium]
MLTLPPNHPDLIFSKKERKDLLNFRCCICFEDMKNLARKYIGIIPAYCCGVAICYNCYFDIKSRPNELMSNCPHCKRILTRDAIRDMGLASEAWANLAQENSAVPRLVTTYSLKELKFRFLVKQRFIIKYLQYLLLRTDSPEVWAVNQHLLRQNYPFSDQQELIAGYNVGIEFLAIATHKFLESLTTLRRIYYWQQSTTQNHDAKTAALYQQIITLIEAKLQNKEMIQGLGNKYESFKKLDEFLNHLKALLKLITNYLNKLNVPQNIRNVEISQKLLQDSYFPQYFIRLFETIAISSIGPERLGTPSERIKRFQDVINALDRIVEKNSPPPRAPRAQPPDTTTDWLKGVLFFILASVILSVILTCLVLDSPSWKRLPTPKI